MLSCALLIKSVLDGLVDEKRTRMMNRDAKVRKIVVGLKTGPVSRGSIPAIKSLLRSEPQNLQRIASLLICSAQ